MVGSLPASARSSPIVVLVSAPVSEQATATMSQALWTKLVATYVGANVVPAAKPDPTLDDCRKAAADYLVVAPFDLRPMLPGLANASGRVAARTHLVVVNCITGTTVVDQNVNLESDPPSAANAGDFESVPEISWARSVPATLKKYPIALERVAHIVDVTAPLAIVDIRTGVRAGDGLRDFSYADHRLRSKPIVLTVTQVFDKYVEVMFSSLGERPGIGDLVEPIPNATATTPQTTPQTTTAPSPAPSKS